MLDRNGNETGTLNAVRHLRVTLTVTSLSRVVNKVEQPSVLVFEASPRGSRYSAEQTYEDI
jgi:hypothetical protein